MMRRFRWVHLDRIILPLFFSVPQLLLAQDSLRFNVPYACPDGSTYVVHRCATGPKGEFCYYQADQESERYNRRADVAYQMTQQCKLKGSASPAPAATAQQPSDLQVNTPYQCAGGLTVTVFQCQKQNGQDYCFVKLEQNGKFLLQVPKPRAEAAQQLKSCKASASFNPPYLSEFPTADRVIEGMKVNTPRETAIRAIAAFYQLSEIIKALAGQRGSSTYLPDEKKLLDAYSAAQSNLEQLAAKNLHGEQLTLATNSYHFSRSDPKFGFDGIPVWVTFLSPSLQAQFAQIVGANNATYNAKIQEERQRAMQDLQRQMQAAQAQSQPMRQDKGSVAARRCMESGRSEMECLGEGMKVGLIDLVGGNPLAEILPKTTPGLRLSGIYSAGNFSLSFDQSSANVSCGTLVPQPLPYTVERAGSQLLIKIPIAPKPLTVALKPDGKLAGPGPIEVAGRIVVGTTGGGSTPGYQMETHTTTQERQIAAADVPNYNSDAVHQNGMEYSVSDQVSTTSFEPAPVHHYATVVTAPKTERCNAAVLPPTASNVKISDALTQVLGTGASKAANTSPGLRLTGTYAGASGLKIEFRDDSATVECGEAHVSEAYLVMDAGGDITVKIQNGATPFALSLQPNGTLAGSGTTNVAGRVVTGSRGDEILYASKNARCEVGTLKAR